METVAGQGALWPAAVAVSGGGDSMALMVMLAGWARANGHRAPVVLTVDHGLRLEGAGEAEWVAARARAFGLAAHTLIWRGRKPVSDIESAARRARYRLMGGWCRAHQVPSLYVAHTLEDQAETFLLRLARGSGVDGLAAMSGVAPFPEPGFDMLRVVRPLLGVSRARLRATLVSRAISWQEDRMNTDPRFQRARLRAVWPVLEEVGLSPRRIADAAGHLARARAALDHDTVVLLEHACQGRDGCILLDGPAIASAPGEIGLRALARILMQVSGRGYRPRFERLEALYSAICQDVLAGGRTLHGCCIRPAPKRELRFGPRTLKVSREPGIGDPC
jgi:tRNA(Ile)-lysidine synthase